MKEQNPLDALRRYVARYPTQRAAADALGVGEVFLSDMLRGRRLISERVLAQLGLRWAVVRAS